MANIDTSKIEGYADMTAEEKVAALEAYSIADPDYSGYVKKDTFDKTASELAQAKKDLKARMTEEEIKAKEAEAELLKYKTEAETLRKEKNIASNKAQLISIGYDEALAQATAEAMENGDIATVIKNQASVLENAKKIAKGEAMASTTPPVGKANDGVKTMSKEQFDNLSYAEMAELYQTNPELYKSLSE